MRPGDRLGGRYRLDRLLGQGAAGQVWLALHETIGRPVAIKILRPEAMRNAAVRFLQEARIAAALQSRFVVSTFDFGTTEAGLPYMVMEHLQGETLAARLARGPPLRVRDLLRYMCQALTGLHEVHRAGIVHRDLKPENIFLVEEGGEIFPKILDFGVSRADEAVLGADVAKLTATGMTVGTPLYMAPEQARGKREQLDARTDLYAMGVIMYRAISGEPPFDDANVVDLLMASVRATVAPALINVRRDLPQALSAAIQKAMAPQQHLRYEDAEALRTALSALHMSIPETLVCTRVGGPTQPSTGEYPPPLATLPTRGRLASAAPRGLASPPPGAASRTFRWWWVMAAAVAVAALVTAMAFVFLRHPRSQAAAEEMFPSRATGWASVHTALMSGFPGRVDHVAIKSGSAPKISLNGRSSAFFSRRFS